MTKPQRTWVPTLLIAAALAALSPKATAFPLPFVELARLTLDTPMEFDRYGSAVAIDDGVAVVGAYGADGVVMQAGAAFVDRLDGSGSVARLEASDGETFDQFGSAVAIEGDVVLVGAPDHADDAGAAYIFRFDGTSWVEEQKLVPIAGAEGDFGYAVAIEDGVAWVGARGANDGDGAVHIFRFDGTSWVESQLLVASDGAGAGFVFGFSLDVHGDTAVIGALNDGHSGNASGSAYVFRFDGSSWVEEQKLTASDAAALAFFGNAVAIGEDRVLIGARSHDGFDGAAYGFTFDGSSWTEQQKISPDTADVFLGSAVAIDGDVAIISAPSEYVNGVGIGALNFFRFEDGLWSATQEVFPSVLEPEGFGEVVAFDGDLVITGALRAEDGGNNSGAAYVLARSCLEGTVNEAYDTRFDILYVQGITGGADRTVEVNDESLIEITLLKPPAGGSGRFVLHANEGARSLATRTLLPFDVGIGCFPFLAQQGATPVIVANNLGRESKLFASHLFGTPTEDPPNATTQLYVPALPLGTELTLQAIVTDNGATSVKQASVSNAVMLHVAP